MTRNQLGSACTGSNPVVVVAFCLFLKKKKISKQKVFVVSMPHTMVSNNVSVKGG